MAALFECKNLTKNYGSRFHALEDVSFSLESGRIVGLLGPNGSGKTTLLKLANGLLQPTSGHILLGGYEPDRVSKSFTSYLPDADYLPDWMSVDTILHMFQDFYRDFNMNKAQDMVSQLHIPLNSRLKNLSKGMREKVELILTMSREAQIYLLDEPIGGVDPAARDYILRTIISNYSEKALVLLSTHLISDVESILDEVVFLNQGHFVTHRSVDEIRETEGKSVNDLFREVFKC